MNSSDIIDNILINLKIISMLQKGEKLCVRKGILAKDSDDHFQSIRRWVHKDSRDSIMLHIRNTILNAIKLSKDILKGNIQLDMKDWTLYKLNEEMKASERGLENLKTTYMNDSVVYASIDTLIARLKAVYEENTGLIETPDI